MATRRGVVRTNEIAALGEVVMGPGDWRRVAVGDSGAGGLMTMHLCESAWLLWKRLNFRSMVAPHPNGPKSDELRRLGRLSDKARARYFRRKALIGGTW